MVFSNFAFAVLAAANCAVVVVLAEFWLLHNDFWWHGSYLANRVHRKSSCHVTFAFVFASAGKLDFFSFLTVDTNWLKKVRFKGKRPISQKKDKKCWRFLCFASFEIWIDCNKSLGGSVDHLLSQLPQCASQNRESCTTQGLMLAESGSINCQHFFSAQILINDLLNWAFFTWLICSLFSFSVGPILVFPFQLKLPLIMVLFNSC